MKKDIKLVLCDLDGTLLNSKTEITPKTREAIKRLKEEGVHFGIASGRPYAGVRRKIIDWELQEIVDVCVCMNGAQLWDGVHHEIHQYYSLKKEWIKEILEKFAPLHLNPCVYIGDKMYCRRIVTACARSARNNNLDIEAVDNDEFFYQEDHEKILYTVEPNQMAEVEAFAATLPKENYRGFKSQADLFEFVDNRVSKSYGIEQFCKLNGFTMAEVLAFGDTTNDIEMLRDCGLGVCMENGTEDAKRVSDAITSSNDEDGIAVYLNQEVFD